MYGPPLFCWPSWEFTCLLHAASLPTIQAQYIEQLSRTFWPTFFRSASKINQHRILARLRTRGNLRAHTMHHSYTESTKLGFLVESSRTGQTGWARYYQ
ncbi:hypothetical protein BABINDRAFT_78580 [Babjeviella inositovora NRRL Y-12698]|uniref:Secreted protein n=1 Tax=Babjeviella inositovora NRRL Y-12698 TaxID=984486 RepID=A0A1E3QZ92_9ASCO|nr:uncharacterized protein BABINDRAFT_78580 [Babjeviella inositovora NRRL Y-12698]ODQ82935.1 hypothetical protein BABINDRAFT_78580 [Babjeviella inositovora NRRL Y-12698]